MSRLEELMDLEEIITPQLLDELVEETMKTEEKQRIQQLCMQKITVLQSACEQEVSLQVCTKEDEKLQTSVSGEKTLLQSGLPTENIARKRRCNSKRKTKRWLTLVAICALILSLSTAAIGTLTTDARLLKLFEADSQSQIGQLNEMSYQIDKSVTDHGYTVTLQEAIHDEHNAWVLLEITGPEGAKLDAEQLIFRQTRVQLENMGGFGYYTEMLPDDDPDDNCVSMVLDLSTNGKITDQEITVSLEDLGWYHYDLEQEANGSSMDDYWETITKGTWQFTFMLPQNEMTVSMWQWKILQNEQKLFLLRKLEVSPLSIVLDANRLQWDTYMKLQEEPIQVYLKDGTMLELDSSGSGSGGISMQFQYNFTSPINLADIEQIVYCGHKLNW